MGKPPGGVTMDKKIKEATELVDTILVGDYFQYKALREADGILDEIENQIDHVPDQDLPSLIDDVEDEMSEDSYERDEEEIEQANAEVEAPMESKKVLTVEESMKRAVKLLVTEETYREFFKSMLKKWNIKSPSDLNDAKKKAFFDAVDKGWKAKKETD